MPPTASVLLRRLCADSCRCKSPLLSHIAECKDAACCCRCCVGVCVVTTLSCAKTAEMIEMPFGTWTRAGQFFTGRMPFLSPNQQRQSNEGWKH